jgi:ATP-dependent Clp protease ATP-binding subunit ClpC
MKGRAEQVRRLARRVRSWNLRWAAGAAILAAWAISAGASGDSGASTILGLGSVALATVADRRRSKRSEYVASTVEDEVRTLTTQLHAPGVWVEPESLATDDVFLRAASRLADRRFPVDRIVTFLSHDGDVYVACAALAALARRDDVPPDWTSTAIRRVRHANHHEKFFLLQALAARATRPVIPSMLSQLDEDIPSSWIAALIERRLSAGETVDPEALRKNVPRRLIPHLERFLAEAGDPVDSTLREAFELWRQEAESEVGTPPAEVNIPNTNVGMNIPIEDLEFLRGIGRVTSQPLNKVPPLLTAECERLVERLLDGLSSTPRRSFLLVGEHGVGKTMLTRAAIDLLRPPWVAFEAGAAAIHAGAVYVGELEARVDDVAQRLSDRRVIWLFPELENALYAGQHSRSPRGLLDALLPYVERRNLAVIGEVTPESYARLAAARPRVSSVFEVLRVHPADQAEAEAIARHVLRSKWNTSASSATLAEAFDLAQHFAASAAPPANVLRLVETAAADVASRGPSLELSVGDVLKSLARGSGLPITLLDPATPLDVDAVRAFFETRVLGQRDAVDCIVDRIALIKAGLTDPTRPLGVFFFVGPTGTGKTELAKATAEFVFGTPDRLVRIDMSEFQTPDSLERLLADTSQSAYGASLVSAVRQNPFSVVLLDEFEKAAGPIWETFLQVFDDGRLTDQQGRTVDFRRCIIILTSNIGSAIPRTAPLGFGRTREAFRAQAVRNAVEGSFRPEFLNRLDQIVVFYPLGRDQMKALLDKELAAVLDRRGLRSRPWAVIFDDSAIDFLIETGFSPEFGARPLKRAVETHLLAPVAKAIVQQRIPQGDQFLFVTAANGRGITVRFVDPDEEEGERAGALDRLPPELARDLDLRRVALTPHGDHRSARFLIDELRRIETTIRGDLVRGRKDAALDAMAHEGFWEDKGRFAVLGEVEHLDRMEAALRTAEKLGERLERQLARRNGTARDLVELLAIRLYVLDRALAGLAEKAPEDVFVRIHATQGAQAPDAAFFRQELSEMYRAWAARRGMRVRQLSSSPDSVEFAVSGLGAGKILVDEAGLHVLERIEGATDRDRHVERLTVTVQVVPWTTTPSDNAVPLEVLASRAFADQPPPQQVVRRYRPEPSPLVRDSARGYRTGRLERVLAGDFDLF